MRTRGNRWRSKRGRLGAGLAGATLLVAVALVVIGATPSGYVYRSNLTVEAEGAGSGTVTVGRAGTDGDGLSCTSNGGDESGDCADTYEWLTMPPSIELIAVAKPGSTFVGWEDDSASCGSNPTCTLVVPSNAEVKARFALGSDPGTPVLTVSIDGTGEGRVTGDGIDCHRSGGTTSGDCTQSYQQGAQVSLAATPDTGSAFSGSWSGACAAFGTTPTCTLTASGAQTVSATFTKGGGTACTITGTSGADTLNGTPGNDVICAKGGNDTVNAKGGNDVVRAGKGADVVNGGKGNDTLLGEKGADVLNGGAGQDTANGGPGIDRCTAETMSSCA